MLIIDAGMTARAAIALGSIPEIICKSILSEETCALPSPYKGSHLKHIDLHQTS